MNELTDLFQRIVALLERAGIHQATLRFFAFMQNKMHYAATGLTAAESIRRRADAEKANMGLTNWSGGRVIKRDVSTAKNYLDANEIDTLNRIVVMFPDRAEFRARYQEAEVSERYLDDLAATAKLLESGSPKPASTLRKPRGKKNVGS